LNLKAKAIKGVKWTTVSTVANTLIQLVKIAVLARFLSPADFGLMAIMTVVIGFSQSFMDMGISNAIIQRQNITHTQLSSLYWLNLTSGFILSVVIALFSPLVSYFYAEPRLTDLMLLLSSVFLIVAVGNQYRVLCQKELQFDRMAKIEITAGVLSLTASIYFAVTGFGVYALVYAMLIQTLVSSGLFLYVGLSEHHRPALVFRHQELKGFYSFGLYQMGEKSTNYISANIDKLLIGKMVGMDAVGFYNMAWQLIIYPLSQLNPIINRVVFPVYSKVQHDQNALNRYYTFSVHVLSLVTVPLLAFLYYFSTDTVLLIFGPGWEQTVVLVNILVFVGVIKALGNPGGALLLALGRADIGFWWNLAWAVLVFATLTTTLYVFREVEMAAYALLVLCVLTGILWHYIICKLGGLSYRGIISSFAKITIVSFIICWCSYQLVEYANLEQPIIRLVVAVSVCCILYCSYILMFERKVITQIKGVES
jgi:lipopolysaccharide exporter